MTVKKLTAALLAVFTVVLCLPFAAAAETGGNISWEVEDKTLVISPVTDTAAIPDYKQGDAPWYSLRNSVESITVNDGITRIGDYAFYGFSKVRTLNYKGAFYNKAVFGSSVTSIGNGAFESCTSLMDVTLPDTVKTVGNSAFRDCTALTSVCLPQKLYSIDGTAGEIPNYLFSGCTKLEIVTFTGKEMQKNINLPVNITRIGKGAFAKCSSLVSSTVKRFDMPNTVKQIDDFAFDGCSGLEFMQVTLSLEYISPSAFKGCTGFGRFIIYNDGWGEYYTSNNDYYTIYNKSETELVRFLPATRLAQFTVSEKVETIGDYAFESAVNLETVTLGSGVKSIGSYAFANSAKLKGIFIPKGVTEIKEGAFDNCPSLGAIYYGGSEADWKSIAINSDNAGLNGKTVYYNSAGIPEKETPNAPSAPELESKTDTTVTLKAVDGCEYRMNDGEWQKSNVFTGLNEDTEYSFYQRIAETETAYASESSKKLTVTTDKKQLPDGETLININGQWQYFKDGKQNFDYCGLVSFYGTWYYVENGVLNWGYTGLTNFYGTWYYVENGVLNWGYTGLTNYYGTWYYVDGGILNWGYTGLTNYYGTWYYVDGGILNWGYTGLTNFYGTWYYVDGGVLNWGYTGLTNYYGTWYYVENGELNWGYTGLTYYYGTWYYVENGVLNWGYVGYTNYYGTWYYVEGGVLR